MKYTVWWREHETWTPYQTGLSRARADRLALQVKNVLSPRWLNRNAPTVVLPDRFAVADAQQPFGNAEPETDKGKGRDWWWWGVIEPRIRRR